MVGKFRVKYMLGNDMKKTIITISLIAITLTAFAATRNVAPSLTSFTTGQVTPRLEARSDFPKYNSSCRRLENMIIRVQGPVTRRPGTRFITDVNNSNAEVRLIPFEHSVGDTYILSLEDGYMGFFRTVP